MQRYEQLWRELEACDELGFDYSFCVEHHFRPDESWMSSPSLYAVGAGARTKRLRIGPMGYIVPLYHPLRLAEEIAIVDQMLGGRMELGLVPGINADYFRPFGLDYGQRKSPTLEFVDYLRAAFGETQPFSFHGQEFHTDNARISVAPAQRPHPPLWMMSRDPQTLEFCAKNAINPGYFLVYPRADAAPRYRKFLADWTGGGPRRKSRTSPIARWSMSTRPTTRRSRRRCFAPAAPTRAFSRRQSPARPSRSAPRNTPKCSSAAASPAPRRSCSICSTAIICSRTISSSSARRRRSPPKSAPPPKPACSMCSWASSISPICRRTRCCARSGCSARR